MKREQGGKATVREKEWLTLAEIQQILGIGRTKVYELVASGEIPAIRIGRILRVNREELDRWLKTKWVADPAER